MVVHDVDDALHAAAVDLVHEVNKVLHGAVFRIDGAVVAVGIGTAEAALFIQHADGVDGHEPDDVRAEGADAVEVRLHRTEGSLRCVTADIELIDHAAAQRGIGVDCHNKALLCVISTRL